MIQHRLRLLDHAVSKFAPSPSAAQTSYLPLTFLCYPLVS